jgi:hypothetical protein
LKLFRLYFFLFLLYKHFAAQLEHVVSAMLTCQVENAIEGLVTRLGKIWSFLRNSRMRI